MENQRKSGAILSYVYIIINCVLGLVYVKFLRDKLGQAEYGMYGTVDSVIASNKTRYTFLLEIIESK